MKKFLLLTAFAAFSLTAFAQNYTVTITDPSMSPVNGVAVFFTNYGNNLSPQDLKHIAVVPVYTNAQGVASSNFNNLFLGDTLHAFTKDCNNQYQIVSFIVNGSNQSLSINSFCAPTSCQSHLTFTKQAGILSVQAYALRDSAALAIPGNRVNHAFSFNGQKFLQPSAGNANYDSIARPISSFSTQKVNVCYSRADSLCASTCDSIVVAGPIYCFAFFTIDSLNSNLMQRSVLIRPRVNTNGTLSSYTVDFGDGNSIITSSDSIIHTYTKDSIYQICLTSTTIRPNIGDTCTSTFCQSLSFPFNSISCVADFDVDYFNSDFSSRNVWFRNNSIANGIGSSYAWDFGNGQQSTQQSPVAQYTADGTYNVCLVMTSMAFGDTCIDSICKTIDVNPNAGPMFCRSFFAPDTSAAAGLGTLNILELSTTRSGNVASWFWDFGDGNTSTNRLPSHTYAPNAAGYLLCLNTVSVRGSDSCYSTYCDTIRFDANGNATFKNGASFTINVIDPATVSLREVSSANFNLYPNPAKGQATLTWEAGIEVKEVAVFALSGQKVMQLDKPKNNLKINNLARGAYIIRVVTAANPITLRLVVE